ERSGQDDPSGRRDPRQRLVGQYEIVEGAKDGEAIPKDRLNNTVAITRDTIAVVDREKKELYSAKYELRRGGERGLWQIDMESKVPEEGAKAVGLLKREGEQLWLIYDLNGVRPENFDKTAKGQHLFKMKRKADEPSLNEPTDEEDDGSGT
ncbi:MAG TPA: hypothetical protein VF170_07540, partial [Planctomycetaceae bacterium]